MNLLLALLACSQDPTVAEPRPAAPAVASPDTRLKRLTEVQYANVMRDLFGEDVVLPSSLDPDQRIEGLYAVGASYTTISSYGVEKYESSARTIAGQIMDSESLRATWVPCEPTASRDDDCASTALATLGRRAWRRPLGEEELEPLVLVAADAGLALDDFHEGLEVAFAALLMSPYLLYRVELGDGEHFDDFELASRLSFFLWNTGPDEELLRAAEAGELSQEAGYSAQVDRLLADERSKQGLRNFFSEMLQLDKLESLSKDPTVFTYMSDALGDSAREETLLGIEALVYQDDGSYLDLFTTRRTFLDLTLAALYDVPAPQRDGFGEIWLDAAQGRRGFLGQASFLALQSHATSTSPTARGIFVREVLLCQVIPDPPADANTGIPEVSRDAATMRDRIAIHLEDPFCASCHVLTDPIGLGFENFDGIGRWRDTENEVQIDASGDLDGETFVDAWEMSALIAAHPETAPCLSQTLLKYATGALGEELDPELQGWHAEGFEGAGHRVLWLFRDVALSPAFRTPGVVAQDSLSEDTGS